LTVKREILREGKEGDAGEREESVLQGSRSKTMVSDGKIREESICLPSENTSKPSCARKSKKDVKKSGQFTRRGPEGGKVSPSVGD